jgi:arsenate reductase
MAEGWARYYHNDKLEVFSAGVEKHGLNQNAVRAMKEAGVDISSHCSKLLNELSGSNFDLVVTVCGNANERCPIFPGKTKVVHIPFADPPALAKNMTDEKQISNVYRGVCEQIRKFILNELPKLLSSQDK